LKLIENNSKSFEFQKISAFNSIEKHFIVNFSIRKKRAQKKEKRKEKKSDYHLFFF